MTLRHYLKNTATKPAEIKAVLIISMALTFLLQSCATNWTKAITYGQLNKREFYESIAIEVQNGLVFINTKIKGKNYRFLFDTGAPFSISKELQNQHKYKKLSIGNIKDSEHNRTKVDWVQVDEFTLGGVSFLNQTAFVADFSANPLFKCLNIDGIIGSNVMRHCNWTLDQDNSLLSLSHSSVKEQQEATTVVSFSTDYQYNIFIDVAIGKAKITNMLVDYGSNGSLALTDNAFTILDEKGLWDTIFEEGGKSQSGIVGNTNDINRKICFSDSVQIHQLNLHKTLIKTGKTVSIGNGILSKYKVTIDWHQQKLYLQETASSKQPNTYSQFRLGYSEKAGVYVQSVVKNSLAYKKGLKPDMKVLQFGTLNFQGDHTFCDFVQYDKKGEISLKVLDAENKIKEITIKTNTIDY